MKKTVCAFIVLVLSNASYAAGSYDQAYDDGYQDATARQQMMDSINQQYRTQQEDLQRFEAQSNQSNVGEYHSPLDYTESK